MIHMRSDLRLNAWQRGSPVRSLQHMVSTEIGPKVENMPEFKLPPDTEGIPWTGERFVVGLRGEIEFEHYHRYLFAAQFCERRDTLDVACGEGYGGFLLSQ